MREYLMENDWERVKGKKKVLHSSFTPAYTAIYAYLSVKMSHYTERAQRHGPF